jgi:hypothetical protein
MAGPPVKMKVIRCHNEKRLRMGQITVRLFLDVLACTIDLLSDAENEIVEYLLKFLMARRRQ